MQIKWYFDRSFMGGLKKAIRLQRPDPQIQELIKQMQSRNQGGEQKVRILESLKRFGEQY